MNIILCLGFPLPPPLSGVVEEARTLLCTVRTNLKVGHKPFANIQTPKMSRLMETSENNQNRGAPGLRLNVNNGLKMRC